MAKVITGFMNATSDSITVTAFISSNGSSLNILKSDILMPIVIMTSKMEQTRLMWSERTFQVIPFVPPLDDPADWLLLNPDRLGFYRVNYDNHNWRSLIQALKSQRDVFSHETIAQLIDDALSLARDRLLSYQIVLNMVESLEQESSIIVWNAASLNILELNNRIRDLDFHQQFRVSHKNQ